MQHCPQNPDRTFRHGMSTVATAPRRDVLSDHSSAELDKGAACLTESDALGDVKLLTLRETRSWSDAVTS